MVSASTLSDRTVSPSARERTHLVFRDLDRSGDEEVASLVALDLKDGRRDCKHICGRDLGRREVVLCERGGGVEEVVGELMLEGLDGVRLAAARLAVREDEADSARDGGSEHL